MNLFYNWITRGVIYALALVICTSTTLNAQNYSQPSGELTQEEPGVTINRIRILDSLLQNYNTKAPFVYPPGWDVPVNTGNITGVYVAREAKPSINGIPLKQNDAIGGFFINDQGEYQCAGAIYWPDTSGIVFSIFGDDPQTPVKEGFAWGETIHYKLFSYDLMAEFDVDEIQLSPDYLMINKWYPLSLIGIVKMNCYEDIIVRATADKEFFCNQGTALLDAEIITGFGNITYSWTSDPPGFSSSLKSPSANVTENTVFKVRASMGNATASSIIPICINHSSMVDAGMDIEVCGIDRILLAPLAQNVSEVQWATSGDGTFENSNAANTFYFFGGGDLNNSGVTLNISGLPLAPCTAVATDQMEITLFPSPQVTIPQGLFTCQEIPVDIEATATNVSGLLWQTDGNGTFSNPTSLVTTYTNGTYGNMHSSVRLTLTGYGQSPCDATFVDETYLQINKPAVCFAGVGATICANETYTTCATASYQNTVKWSTSGDGTFSDDTQLITTYTPGPNDKITGKPRLTLCVTSIAPCTGSKYSRMDLWIKPEPTVNAIDDFAIINTDIIPLNATASSYSSLQWSTSGDGTFAEAQQAATNYYPGPDDIEIGTVILGLQANPLAPCATPAQDELMVSLVEGAKANAGPDLTICGATTVTLQGSASNYVSVLWSTSGDGTFSNANQLTTQYTPGTDDEASGEVVLTLTPFGEPPFVNGNPDHKTVTILQPAVVNKIIALTAVCQTQAINLSATASHYASLMWTSSGNGAFNNTSIINPQYTPGTVDIANGSVVITVTAASVAPCSGNATKSKTIQIKHAPVANAGNDVTVCQGTQVPVNGTAQHNGSILWTTTGDGVFANPQQLATSYIPGNGDVQSGTVTFTLTAAAIQPCTVSAADQLVAKIFKNPVCNAGIDIVSCEREPIAISGTATNYNSLVWETTGSGTFANKYAKNTTYHPSDQDVTNGGVTLTLKALPMTPCQITAEDSKLITLSVSPIVVAGNNIIVCEQQSVQLNGTATNAQSVIWSSDGNGVFANASSLSTTYTPGNLDITNGKAVLHLTAISGNACNNVTGSLTVSIIKNPVVNAGNDGQVALGSSFKTNEASAIHTNSTLWTTPNGDGIIQNANAIKATYVPVEADYYAGVVTLILTAAPINPCITSVSDEINLIVTSGCEDATAVAGADMEICYYPNTPITLAAATAQNHASLLWTTQGDGTFSNATQLHPNYTPGNGDAQNGFVILNLLARGTGVCNDATDQIKIVLIQPATVDAGIDATICVNQSFNTNGAASNTEALQWTTSGDGSFAIPNQLKTTYLPGTADRVAGQVQLCLSAEGLQSCPAVSDCMTLHFQPLPTIFAGSDLTLIVGDLYNTNVAQAYNFSSLLWSTSGDGTFTNPLKLSTIYTPGQMDCQNMVVTLTLTAYSKSPCMGSIQDDLVITFVNGCEDATVDVGPDRTVCESANVDLGGVVQNQTSVLWNTNGDGTFDASANIDATYFPGTADLANGNVQLCLTAFANGECNDATDYLNITFGKAPIANAGPDISTCKTNAFVKLNGQAQNNESFQWITLGTGYFVPPTSSTPKYFFSGLDKEVGEVQLIFAVTNAACGTAADTMTITLLNPPLVSAGADATICASQPFTNNDATATDFSALLWSTNGDGTFDDASMLHATYTAGTIDAAAGTVTLTLAADGQSDCQQAQSSHTLTLIPSAYANAGEDRTICETGTVSLTGQAANYESLLWETTGDGTFANAAALNTIYFPGAGDLTLRYLEISLTAYAAGNCGDDFSELQINILPAPFTNAGNNQQICAGEQVQLSATAANYDGLLWSTNGDGIFSNPSALSAMYTPGATDLSSGGVTLCLTAVGTEPCGEVMDCLEIDIIALPTVNAGADATLCQNKTLLLTGNAANYSSLQWTTAGDGTFTNTSGANAQYYPGNGDISAGNVVICLNAQGLSGCGIANDCMVLTLQKNPVVFAGNDATIDQGSSFQTLQANAQNYSWLEWSTSGSGTFANPLQAVTTYTPSQADCQNQPVTLTLTALPKNPCTASVSDALLLTINILDLMADAGDDAVICSGQNLQLAAQAINYSTLQWSTSGNGTFDDATALNPIYIPCSSDAFNGPITLCLKAFGNDAGQSITDCLTLTFQHLPIAFAGSDNTVPIDEGCPLHESFAENYETIQWYTSNGMGMFDKENILHPTYYASPMDITQSEIFLYMAVSPMSPCEIGDEDMVAVKFVNGYANATAYAGADMHLCKGLETEEVSLTEAVAENFSSILWSTGGTGTFNYDHISRPQYYPSEQDLANGSVTLTMSVAAFGTYAPATDQIVLYFDEMPQVWAGNDMTVCSTDNLQLYGTASNYASLTWTTTGDGVFVNGNTPQATYYPGPGDVIVPSVTLCLEAEGYGECFSASDCMTVTFVPVPGVSAGIDAAVCAGSSHLLQGTASNFASVLWTTAGDGNFDNATLLQAKYTPGAADILSGSVKLCLTAQGLMGCPENTSCMTITIQRNPIANAGQDAVAITGQQYLINDATAQFHSAVQWITSGDGIFGNAGELNTTYTPSAFDEQQQQVTLTLQAAPINPCTVAASDEKQLTITPDCQDAIADAGTDLTVCYGGAIALSATAQNHTGVEWNTNGDGTFDASANIDATYFPGTADLVNGNVQLCLTAFANGECNDATDCIEITFGTVPIVNAGEDVTICTTEDFIQLEGIVINGDNYQWISTGQGYFDPTNQLVTKYIFSRYDKIDGYVDLILAATKSPCPTVYDTLHVTFNPDPIVYAGEDATICGNDEYLIFEAFAAEYQSLEWTTSGDGTFEDATALNTIYYPGSGDIDAETIELQLIAYPLEGCAPDASSFMLTLIPSAYANAGSDLTICETEIASLFGQASGYESLLWETSGDGIFGNAAALNTTYLPGAGDLTLGQVEISLTAFSSGNCGDAVSDMLITILPVPTANAGNSQHICAGDQVQLSATAANYASLSWSTSGDGVFSNPSALSAMYTPGETDLQNGFAELCLTAVSAAACVDAYSCIEIVIESSPVANAGANAVICQNQNYQLSANAENHSSIAWSTLGDGSFDNAASPAAIYTPGAADISQGSAVLILTAFADGVCADATDEMLLTIQLLPVINAGTDFTICESNFAQLNATGTNYSSILWITIGDGTFDDAALPQAIYFPGVNDVSNGFANLTITAQGILPCTQSTDDLHITLQPVPEVAAMENASICPDQSITVEGFVTHYQSVFWSTTGDGTFATPQTLTSVYFPGTNDIETGGAQLCLTAIGLYDCGNAQACMQLTIISLPEVTAGNDVTICNTGIVELSAQANNYETLQWMSDGDGTFSASTALLGTYAPSANDIAVGSVKLCLNAFAANGCGQSQDCLIVTLEAPPTADAGIDQTLCVNQNATVSGVVTNVTSVLWSTSGDGTFGNSSALTTIYYPGAADYVNLSVELCLTANGNGICDPVSDCVEMTFQPGPTAFAGNDVTLCANQNVPLQAAATEYSSVFWSTSGTGSFSNPQILNPTYFPSQADKNNGFVQLTIRANGANGCGYVTDAVAVTFVPVPVANAGADATTCQTTPYLLNGSAQNTISMQWATNGDGTFDNPASAVTAYTPGTNDVVVGYVNLCLQAIGQSPCGAVNDCMKLTIMKSPTVNPGADIVSCGGNQVSLQGQAANQQAVLWSTNGDGTFANTGALSSKYFPGTADISNGGAELCLTAFGKANCDAVSECLTLSIVDIPVAYAGVDATIEQGDSYQLQDASAENYSQIIWHTSGNGVFTDVNDLNTIYTPSNYDFGQDGVMLTLEAEPENPCNVSATDEMMLTIERTGCIDAEADAGADLTICTGQSIEMENAEIYFAESVLWKTSGDGTFDNATLQHPDYFPGPTDDAVGKVTLSVNAFAVPPCQDATDFLELTILQNAVAYAGGSNTIPEGMPYEITDAWAENASMILWYTTNGMGTFLNSTSVNAGYFPSSFDYYQDTIHLIMAVASINPCILEDTDEMALSFSETGEDAQVDAGANVIICGNDSIVALSGSATYYNTLQWTTSGDGTFNHPNSAKGSYNLGAADQEADEITLYLQASAFDEYACAIDSLTITKLAGPLAEAGSDKTVCEGCVIETSLAYAENYASLLWTTSGDGTFDDASALITMYSPGASDAANGEAKLTLTAFALAPCTNPVSSSFVLTIDPLPTFLINLTDTYVVIGERIIFNVEVEYATRYQWYGPDGMKDGSGLPKLLIDQAVAEDEGYYYCEVSNACGTICSNVVYLEVYEQQTVMVPAGWSGISSWIVPGNPDIEAIFAPYQDDLILARNYSGMYYPQVNVNTLNLWNTQTGYTVKFVNDVTFKLAGNNNTNRTIEMFAGWNYLPVISSCPVDIATLFADFDTQIQVIKEIAGTGVYWPSFGINTIGELQSGRAYEIRALQPFSMTFADCDGLKSSVGAAHLQPTYDTPWNDVNYSPASHSIAIHDDLAAMLQPGDILGAFTASGICAGAHQMSDFGNAIVLFGDDALTNATDGFTENEIIRFEVVRPSTGEQFALEISYDQAYACHNGRFVSGGVSAIHKASATAILTPDDAKPISVYPNPASGVVFVSGVKSDMQIELRNVNGQVLQTIPCQSAIGGNDRVAVDVSSFASGVIYMRIYNETHVIHRKLIVN